MSWRKLVVLWVGAIACLVAAGCGGSSKPIGVSVTASPTTVDATNTSALTATVANDKKSAGVTWSVTGGGALSNTTTSAATYTAPAASSSALSVTVTATSVADTTKTGTVTITVPAAPAVTTTTLAAGAVGTAYAVSLAGSGGIPPYTWTITSGILPPGLSMTSAGAISGTPTAASVGSVDLTFKMTDAGSPNALSATSSLNLTINAAPAISFTTTTLTAGTYKSAYSATVAATGGAGALTYSISAGALPTGLTMSAAGVISGTPTVVGTFPITVMAADAFGDSATKVLSLTVSYPPLTVTGMSLPTGYVSSVYTATTLAATGGSGTGYTWALQSGSSLPAGLVLSAAGAITGTPTTAGTSNFTVVVTDSASNTGKLAMSIVVKPAVSITTGLALPTGYVGSTYAQTLAATGGSGTGYTWAISSGSSAPAGLGLSASGVLSGTPTATGTPTFGVTVTDSVGNKTSATFSMTISPGISITTATALPYGYQGSVYAPITLAATGGSGAPYTWTWAAAGGSSLPAGMMLSSAGVISGTPTAAGSFSIAITAKDGASNTKTNTFTLTVEATVAVTNTTLPSGTINVAYSHSLAASGGSGSGYTWAVTAGGSTLTPLNLSLSAAGVLSGTPTTTGSAAFTVKVTDTQSHTATANLTVSVYNALTVTTTTLPVTDIGAAYSQTLNAGGGSGSGYTWTATSSNLATYGLALSSGGVVSGTPTTAGTASFTAKVTDSANNTAIRALTITINAALSLPSPNPGSLPNGYVGISYTGSVSGSGGSGNLSISVTSGLPSDGLSATTSGSTVNIAGTPTANASVSFMVKLTDNTVGNSITQTYTIPVTTPTAPSLPAGSGTVPGSATVSTAYNSSISASGGVGPTYTWTVNSTTVSGNLALSDGLSVSNSGGSTLSITGTPTAVSTSPGVQFTASVKDNASNLTSSTQTYTIAVNAAGQNISGQVILNNNCGGGSQPTFQVSINYPSAGSPTTVTTDGSGNYTFTSIPNGTYTITPSISGATSSLFSPATGSVTVNNAGITGQNFNAAVGYTVSGTVSYGGAQTGQTYLVLNNNNCSGSDNSLGTSISETTLTSGGAFSIRGVPPGSYTLQAWMDPIGQGAQNKIDPTGSASVTVTSASKTNAAVTIANPTFATPSSNPGLQASGTAGGALIFYQASSVKDSNGNKIEDANQYTVQWSTSPTLTGTGGPFAAVTGTKTFDAIGTNGATLWILNSVNGVSLTSGTTYYFQARSLNTLASTTSPTGWSTFSDSGGNPKGVAIGAASCTTSCTTVSGAVTIPSGVTIASGAPLYVGFYQQSSSGKGPSAIYATEITSPTVGANSYSINIPSGSGYFLFGIVDQNKNGQIDAGDVQNTDNGNNNSTGITVSGSTMTGQNSTLPGVNSTVAVTTQYQSSTNSGGGGSSTNYYLNFDLRKAIKLPVSVTLTSGPNFMSPVDMAACTSCGTPQFQYLATLPGGTPAVGDTYAFTVTYSDGTQDTGSTINGKITAWDSANGGTTVVGAANLPTNLAPAGASASTSTTPTFTWTFPANPSDFTYSFYIYQNNCSGSCSDIWDVPSQSGNSSGFTYAETSGGSGTTGTLVWGTDPISGDNSSPSGPLSLGTTYNWTIQVKDSDGNQAQASTWYQP